MESQSLREKASEETLISLLQLDPSPIESPLADEAASDEKQLGQSSDEDAPVTLKSSKTGTSTSSLGLSGHAGHGAIYYREPLPFPPATPQLDEEPKLTFYIPLVSIPHPALLLLHIHRLRLPPPSHNIPHPPRDPVRPGVGSLPPPRPRDLPDPALGAPPRRPAPSGPRPVRRRHPSPPPLPEPKAVRRRDTPPARPPPPTTTAATDALLRPGGKAEGRVAPAVVDILLRLRAGAGGGPARVRQQGPPARGRGGQRQHRPRVREPRVRAARGGIVGGVRGVVGGRVRAYGLGVGQVVRTVAEGRMEARSADGECKGRSGGEEEEEEGVVCRQRGRGAGYGLVGRGRAGGCGQGGTGGGMGC